jgi:hypothetical protein
MAEATEKVYEVLPGKKYTGKHGVYVGKCDSKIVGDKFKESEIMGGEEHLEMALKGSDKYKVKPVIKISTAKAKK